MDVVVGGGEAVCVGVGPEFALICVGLTGLLARGGVRLKV